LKPPRKAAFFLVTGQLDALISNDTTTCHINFTRSAIISQKTFLLAIGSTFDWLFKKIKDEF